MVMKAEILHDLVEDGLENLVANMGTGNDKNTYSRFVNNRRLSHASDHTELDALYRTNWVAGKTVDIIPEDMSREWRTYSGDISPEIITDLVGLETELDVSGKYEEANKWARLYGTSFIVIAVDDGQNPYKPLNIDTIKKGSLKHLTVIDRHRIDRSDKGVSVTENPMDPNYGLPTHYRLRGTNIEIHHTRMIRFDGIKLPFDEFRRNNYWSDSILDRLYDPILDFTTSTSASSSMIHEANVDIVKIKGLMNHLQTDEGEALIKKRLRLAKTMKANNNILILDSEEDFQTKNNTFTGVADLTTKYAQYLSGASDIPATRMLGISASGFNATGEGDLKNYYDKVGSNQNKQYKPSLAYLDLIMAKSLGLADGLDLSFVFDSLFQLTDSEKAELELKNSQRDAAYIDRDVVPRSVVTKGLKEDSVYTNITDEIIEELEKEESEEEPDNTFLPQSTDPLLMGENSEE